MTTAEMNEMRKQMEAEITKNRAEEKERLFKKFPELVSESEDNLKSESNESLVHMLKGCVIAVWMGDKDDDKLFVELFTDEILRRMKGGE